MEYIAVFKTLSYANRLVNFFDYKKAPEIIKTPKKIKDGCSYSVVFGENKLYDVKRYLSRNKKGFIGLYVKNNKGEYTELPWDEVIKNDISW